MPALPALQSGRQPAAAAVDPLPPPAVGNSHAWLHELDGLLKAHHEQLFTRLDLRLEAAVTQLKESHAATRADVRPRFGASVAPCVVPGEKEVHDPTCSHTPSMDERRSNRSGEGVREQQSGGHAKGTESSRRARASPTALRQSGAANEDLDQEDQNLHLAATMVSDLHRTDTDDRSGAKHASALKRLVNHPRFESFFAVMILTNAIFIAVQTDLAAKGINQESHGFLFILSAMYTLIFAAEIVLRIGGDGRRVFFWGENAAWNALDLFVVLASLLEAGLSIAVRANAGMLGDSQGPTQFRVLRVVRITKVIRLIRVTRIVRFVRALRTLVHQIMSALRSLIWALLLLMIVIFLFAVLFTQATTAHRMQPDGNLEPLRFPGDASTTYWSTLPRSMYTLFKAITGGISWEEVAQPLSDIGELWVVIFLAYICFAQMAVLNVLTGVFCQNAIDSAAHDQDLVTQSVLAHKRMYVNQIQQIFKEIDSDNSGSITIQEFKDHLENERMRAYFDSLGLDTSDIWTLFKLLDVDKGCIIEFDEFVSGCLRLKGYAKGVDIAKLSYEHRWMAKRLGKFMNRTDEALACLLAEDGHDAPKPPEEAGHDGGSAAEPYKSEPLA